MEKILEILANLEHEQWMEWSKNIAETESISQDRLERWKKMWIPYSELSEEVKEQDRIYARKVLSAIRGELKKKKKAKSMSSRDWQTHYSKINTNL